MPELPEVETITQDLNQKVIGQSILDVVVYDKRVIRENQPGQFLLLKGRKIESISRRGKGIMIKLSGGYYLVVHLRMTGQLIYGKHLKDQGIKETKIVFKLSSGSFLNYNDQRLFGTLTLVKDLNEVSFLKKLGPEPLNGVFTAHWLKEQLKTRTTPIKTLLLNQQFLAGIGNIYASEILFKAGIDPKKKASRLSFQEIGLLHDAVRSILKEAIQFRGTSMRNYRDSDGAKGNFKNRIKVYGLEGEPCIICHHPIIRVVQAGRSTFYCKKCQK